MNKKQLYQEMLISIGMIMMFAYGVMIGNKFGNYGYFIVLLCGIIVFIYLIFKHKLSSNIMRRKE